MRSRSLSFAQRVVLVVGLGASMLVGWLWWYLGELSPDDGWFAYIPNTSVTFTDTYFVVRDRQLVDLAVPLVLVVVWTAASVWVLGGRRPPVEPG